MICDNNISIELDLSILPWLAIALYGCMKASSCLTKFSSNDGSSFLAFSILSMKNFILSRISFSELINDSLSPETLICASLNSGEVSFEDFPI